MHNDNPHLLLIKYKTTPVNKVSTRKNRNNKIQSTQTWTDWWSMYFFQKWTDLGSMDFLPEMYGPQGPNMYFYQKYITLSL